MSIIELETPWCFNAMSLEQHEVEKLQKYFVDEGNHQCDWQNSEYCGITSDGLSEYFRSSEHFDENEDSDNVTVYTIEQLRDIIAEHLAKQPVEKLEDGVVYHSEHTMFSYLFVNEKEWINLSSKMFYEGGISWDDMHQSSTHVITKATPEQIAHYEACVKAGKYVEPESVIQFVVGKWYKYDEGRYFKYKSTMKQVGYNQIYYSEKIVGKNHSVSCDYIASNDFEKHALEHPVEDLSEIQDLLPDRHPDKQAKVYLDDEGRPLKEFKVGSWYTNPCFKRKHSNGNPACFFRVSSCKREVGYDGKYYFNTLEFDEVADKDWNIEARKNSHSNTDYDQEMVEVFPVVKSERYLATMKFFEQLREPERSGAIANYDEGYDSDVPESLSDALIIGFRWGDSNQTYSYWDRIKNSVDDKTYFKEELLVFGKYKVGDIVVSLALKEMFKVSDKSKEDLLVMEQGTYTDSSLIRPATPEEVEAYNQGVRNIANIKPKDYKEAVHCTTQEEWDFVLDTIAYTKVLKSNFENYTEDSYIDTNEQTYGNVYGFGTEYDTILTFNQWCEKYGRSYEVKPWVAEVGDWVYVLKPMSSCLLVGDIVKCDSHSSIGSAHFETHRFNNNTPNSYLPVSCYRKATQEEIDSVIIQPVFPDQKMYLIDESEGLVNGWTADNWYVEVTSQSEANAVIDAAAKMYDKPYDKIYGFNEEWKYVGSCRKNKDYSLLRIGLTQEGAKPRPITDFIQPEKKSSIFEQLRESMFDSDMAWYKLHSTIEKHKQQDELVIYKPKQTRLVEPGAVSANVSTTNLIIKSNSKYL